VAKSSGSTSSATASAPPKQTTSGANTRKIWPVIMYPYRQPQDTRHLECLYDHLHRNLQGREEYAEPITVLNCQTFHRNHDQNPGFDRMLKLIRSRSEVIDAWCTDTCAMWLRGLSYAFEKERGVANDVFWLIPGDFDHAGNNGQSALDKMLEIPREVYNDECELCLGEITVANDSTKQLIDTHGRYGLLYNWFPAEAEGILKITAKPRTEFFAISRGFLKAVLVKGRWYAYEQTIAILLQNMKKEIPVRDVKPVNLGNIDDDPSSRSKLVSAMQQVERTERVLKHYWQQLHEAQDPDGWIEEFRRRDRQSEQIRGAAMTILQLMIGK
jgi:hypothetical protein